MSKFFVALLVVSLVAFVTASFGDDSSNESNSSDDSENDDIPNLFGKFSNMDDSKNSFRSLMLKPLTMGADFVKQFVPPPGGTGNAQFKSVEHKESSVNGKKVMDETKKDQVDNDNGQVTEEKSDN